VYSDKLFVLTPAGDLRILLDEGDPQKVAALEVQLRQNHVTVLLSNRNIWQGIWDKFRNYLVERIG
jgi:hypothetical protein